MIDSLNFTIKNIFISDIKDFSINFKKCRLDGVFTCNYKGIHFNYYSFHHVMTLSTHTAKILDKQDITEKDACQYLLKLKKIIKEILIINRINLHLTRCDYCTDIKISSKEELDEILILLNKHHKKFRYIKSLQDYKDSVYLLKPKSRNLY